MFESKKGNKMNIIKVFDRILESSGYKLKE
jgi:hypothetical protein